MNLEDKIDEIFELLEILDEDNKKKVELLDLLEKFITK